MRSLRPGDLIALMRMRRPSHNCRCMTRDFANCAGASRRKRWIGSLGFQSSDAVTSEVAGSNFSSETRNVLVGVITGASVIAGDDYGTIHQAY